MGVAAPILKELSEIVEVLPEEENRKYESDRWVYLRLEGARGGHALAVVRPKDEHQVAQAVKLCARGGLRLTCRGGGSSVTGSSVPIDAVVMDMSMMSRIIEVDRENMVVRVEAGARLSDVEAQLNRLGYTLGQFPQSFHLATVGGYLSTMGTGEFSGEYGGAEDSCLSLRVVLPDGSIVDTRSTDAPRSSAGPDTTRLFIGAEGSLGVIVSARLKIYRLSAHTVKLAYTFQEFIQALSAAKSLLELDVKPAVCRVYNEQESSYVFGQNSPVMLLIYHFRSPRIAEALTGEVRDTLTARGAKEADAGLVDKWLVDRFKYDEQLGTLYGAGYIVDTVEIGSSWSNAPALYGDLVKQLPQIEGVVGFGAHVSHIYNQGACVYITVIMKPNANTYTRLWEAVGALCKAHRATVSHHHGVGLLKSGLVKHEIPFSLLEQIKRALDPHNTMNPNKLL
ncbi:hypothetical protein B9Q03_02770 [Candidatus Marsarchaeota G2 archaeon OSP_D]|jgi:alkyldihydroxyacetonephosphate synthase|uniref:FAD-binding PCMH-type domain-containing protein n=2 Tax=Candidatus Marsarchaeota group 2 TaxID=2203771 RepID=A0A2R6CDA0_9ARCH|nr:MAG: hypothetical protein B9Q03_02770 [Candidatus Marsarchaeota G2 archaeon OSP_D]PSO08877.1 MAG: hypothetical protein B9Q04_03320 [Candidatus Marsarchaeota G2 archaeon BE_D]